MSKKPPKIKTVPVPQKEYGLPVLDHTPREKLANLVRELREIVIADKKRPPSPFLDGLSLPETVSHDLVDWFAKAADAYLSGTAKRGLESALGLKRSPGGKAPGIELDRAVDIFWLVHVQGASWDAVYEKYPDINEATLRKSVSKYRDEIIKVLAHSAGS